MGTGPEHYVQAVELLRSNRMITVDELTPAQLVAAAIAEAQVHATLALAAATALPQTGEMSIPDSDAWAEAAGAHRGQEAAAVVAPVELTVWWLDDGGESPEPDLYAAEHIAQAAAMGVWKANNPLTPVVSIEWPPADSAVGDPDTDCELHVNHRATGYVVRARQPKTSPAAKAFR